MRLITDILRDIRGGRVVTNASDALALATRQALLTGKPAEVNIKLTIKPQGRGDNVVIVVPKVTSKIPQADLPDGMFFASNDGDLLREDPTQVRMFAGVDKVEGLAPDDEVDPETGEVRTAAAQ